MVRAGRSRPGRSRSRQGAAAPLAGDALGAHYRLDAAASRLLQSATTRLGWSARSFHRVLRVARTIADLAASTYIAAPPISARRSSTAAHAGNALTSASAGRARKTGSPQAARRSGSEGPDQPGLREAEVAGKFSRFGKIALGLVSLTPNHLPTVAPIVSTEVTGR